MWSWLCLQWHFQPDLAARTGAPVVDLELRADQRRALAHASRSRARAVSRGQSEAIVTHDQDQAVEVELERQLGPARCRMARDVGQGFLGDPVDDQLDLRGERGKRKRKILG